MEEQTTSSIWGGIDIALIIFAAIIVLIVLYFQIKSFKETRKKVYELISFFPNVINSINIDKLHNFQKNFCKGLTKGQTCVILNPQNDLVLFVDFV